MESGIVGNNSTVGLAQLVTPEVKISMAGAHLASFLGLAAFSRLIYK